MVTSPQPALAQWSDMCCVRSHKRRVIYSLGAFDAFQEMLRLLLQCDMICEVVHGIYSDFFINVSVFLWSST